MTRRVHAILGLLASCAAMAALRAATSLAASPSPAPPPQGPSSAPADGSAPGCAAGRSLRAHFYDVAQGLAVLIDLPDGHHVLVDTGDAAGRSGCGDVCGVAERHLLDRLRVDLAGAPI